jgi:pimeloyl-ACP methyl ester carboxylesterase
MSMSYVDQGESTGMTIVLIHGLGDSLRSYEPVQAHLPDDVRLLVPSLRGHGDADRPQQGYTPADHVEDIRAVLEDAGVAHAVIGGHSSGSQIAQLFALTYPERIRGLVLIGAPGPRPDPAAATRMSAEIDALEDPIDERWLRDFARARLPDACPMTFWTSSWPRAARCRPGFIRLFGRGSGISTSRLTYTASRRRRCLFGAIRTLFPWRPGPGRSNCARPSRTPVC